MITSIDGQIIKPVSLIIILCISNNNYTLSYTYDQIWIIQQNLTLKFYSSHKWIKDFLYIHIAKKIIISHQDQAANWELRLGMNPQYDRWLSFAFIFFDFFIQHLLVIKLYVKWVQSLCWWQWSTHSFNDFIFEIPLMSLPLKSQLLPYLTPKTSRINKRPVELSTILKSVYCVQTEKYHNMP